MSVTLTVVRMHDLLFELIAYLSHLQHLLPFAVAPKQETVYFLIENIKICSFAISHAKRRYGILLLIMMVDRLLN